MTSTIPVKFILKLLWGELLLIQISLDTGSNDPNVLKTKTDNKGKLSVSVFHLTNPKERKWVCQTETYVERWH